VIAKESGLSNNCLLIELIVGVGAAETALKFGPVMVFKTNSFTGSF
jgi:hypothetical protein